MSAREPARGAVEFAAWVAPDSNKGSVRIAVASNLHFRRAFIRLSNLLVVNDLEAWCFLAHAHASNIGQISPVALFLSKSTTKLLSRTPAQRARQKEMAYGAG
jgi:hypothetical protein